jgi:hypothetical protein
MAEHKSSTKEAGRKFAGSTENHLPTKIGIILQIVKKKSGLLTGCIRFGRAGMRGLFANCPRKPSGLPETTQPAGTMTGRESYSKNKPAYPA